MSRLGTLASRLRRVAASPPRDRDAPADDPRTRRAHAWAGLYLALVGGDEEE